MKLPEIETLADGEAVATRAAEFLVGRARSKTGAFRLALSGGSTPKRLFEKLADPVWCDRMPWERVHLFWGDERFVPYDHPDSNYGMARATMIAHVPIPPAQIFPMPTNRTPEDGAARYNELLGNVLRLTGNCLFDVTLLGLGEDGHTASLFPGVAALDETKSLAVAVIGAKPEPRLTLTYPALNSSHEVCFLVVGAGKQPMLTRLRQGDQSIPASRVNPQGALRIFADKAAMGV